MDKKVALEKLHQEIEADTSLPLREANLVFGEGNPDCAVLFIGEAPGEREDQLKRPFVGRSGQLLDKMILKIGWKREDVYISNIVKRRPPGNRDPLPEEIESYKPYLKRQIEILNPPIIATLGRFSMNYFLPLAKISRDHGKLFTFKDGEIERKIVPLYHPAAALRATAVLNDLEADFKKLPLILAGKPTEESLDDLPPLPPKPKTSAQEKLF